VEPGTAGTITALYDEDVADRIRALIGAQRDLTEKQMFAGLAFLVGGDMAIAASGQSGVLVRVDPSESDAIVDATRRDCGDARPSDVGLAARRARVPARGATAREVGPTGCHPRPITAQEEERLSGLADAFPLPTVLYEMTMICLR